MKKNVPSIQLPPTLAQSTGINTDSIGNKTFSATGDINVVPGGLFAIKGSPEIICVNVPLIKGFEDFLDGRGHTIFQSCDTEFKVLCATLRCPHARPTQKILDLAVIKVADGVAIPTFAASVNTANNLLGNGVTFNLNVANEDVAQIIDVQNQNKIIDKKDSIAIVLRASAPNLTSAALCVFLQPR